MSEASNEGNTLIEYSFYKYAGRQVMKINLDTAPPPRLRIPTTPAAP